MKLFAPFDLSKADDDQRIVSGYASTEALDSQNEIVTRKAMEAAIPGWLKFGNIREMHQPSAVGVAVKAHYDDVGLLLEAHIVDDNAWKKVKAGVYKGFSIGGRVKSRDKANKSVITDLDLTEISIVDRPANPEALFDVWKADGPQREGVTEQTEAVASEEPVSKGMMAVGMLANVIEQVRCLTEKSKIEEAKEGDTDSAVPAALQDAMNQLGDVLNQMVAEETAELAAGTGAECGDPFGMPLYLGAANEDIEKKAYTDAERKDMVSDGRAMSDGSYPIANKQDLENAIKAVGRAKDKVAARAHIERRARELGMTDMIPDGWADKADTEIDLEKKGARTSAADQKKLDDAHDAIVAAGANCGAMKHDSASDLAKAHADLVTELAKAQTQVSDLETSVASANAARDDVTATLANLTKAHATITDERNDLAKRHEALVTEKASADAELTSLKTELETLKKQPEPIKGKVMTVAKADDITPAPPKLPSVKNLPKDAPPKWFGTRPTGDSINGH